jgi:NitT/TauT family transport system ATP-binding protein
MSDDEKDAPVDEAVEKAAAAARKAAKGKKHAPITVSTDKPPKKAAAKKKPSDEDAGSATNALDVDGVWKRYPSPSGGHQVILNDINLKVPEPQFISVVGPSGCGKSTLLRLILGQESPWRGSVRAAGQSVVHPDRNRGIVFQKYSLFPHLTVLENVMFGLELDGTWLLQKWLTWPWYKKQHEEYKATAMEYLKTVRLDEHAGKYPHQLSGGMQQRVAIAQAMIMKPTILLMDEPFGALDPGTREDLQVTIIETFEQQNITIFFVTHDLEEAIFVGDRLLVLSNFYSHEEDEEVQGAKLVMDVPTPEVHTTQDKKKGEFREFIDSVRRQGFDPAHRQHIDEFDLRAAH